MNRNDLVKQIESVLATEITLGPLARKIAKAMSADIPGTPQIRGKHALRPGARVAYIIIAKKKPDGLSDRASQVMAFIKRKHKATTKALQAGLRVNRNVIAGAIHELKQAGVVAVEALSERRSMVESASGYGGPERRRATAHDRAPRKRRK